MASTTFRFQADAGQTLTTYLVADGGTGTPAASYSTTHSGGGWYTVTITQALEGIFRWYANDPNANTVANGIVDLLDTTDRFFGFDPATSTGEIAGGSGGDGSGFTAIPWNAAWDAEVQSEVDDALQAKGYTSTRAGYLDNLDATITSRQSESNASTRYDALIQEHVDTQAAITAIDVTADVQAGLTAQGYTTGRAPNLDNLDAAITTRESESSASSRASTNQTEHDATQSTLAGLASASTIAGAVWSYLTASIVTADSIGELILTNLNATITSRQSETDADTRYDALIAEHDATQTAVGAITASVGAGDIEDIADAVWQYLATAATTSGSLGKLLVDNLNATISSRQSETDASTRHSALLTDHDTTQAAIAALNDLDTTDIAGVLTSQGYTGTRAGYLDNLDAAVSSRQSETTAASRHTALLGDHDTTQAAIAAIDVAAGCTSALTTQGYTSTRAGKLDNLDNLTAAPPTAAAVADAVLDEVLSGHQTTGTAGEAIQVARDQAVIAASNTQV